MAEYVDREKVIKEIDKGDLLVGNNAEWAKEIVYRTPTEDVRPVVRCKDCKYYETGKDYTPYCTNFENLLEEMNPDDYCSYGERKEENG